MDSTPQRLTLDPGSIRNLELRKIGSEFRASLVDDDNDILLNGFGVNQNEALNDLLRNLI